MNHFSRRALWCAVLLALTMGQTPPVDMTPPPAPPSESKTTTTDETPTDDATAPPSSSSTPTARSRLPGGANVAIIPIEGMIYDFTTQSLDRRIDRAIQNGATLIVLEIDTYGGVVTSALDISKHLKDPTDTPVPVLAWVHNKAYSAGILIAAAADQGIVMSSGSATGDCAPIVPGMNLAPTERAKAFSPIATEFRSSAAAHGYTFATFHAMCVLGVELYLIERTDPVTGKLERKLVNQADHDIMVKGDTAAWSGLQSSAPVDPADPNAPPAVPAIPGVPGVPGVPNLPGFPGAGTGGTEAPAAVERILPAEASAADVGQWKPVTTLPSGRNLPGGLVHDGQSLFTPDNVLALDIGLSKATISSDAELKRYLQAASLTRVEQTWSENFAAFLTNNWVRVGLMIVLALGVYLELQAPGLGVPGALAVLALLGLFGAPMVVGLADLWHVLLFAVGLALLIIELFFTPTFGALGVVGIVVMLASLVLAVVPTGGGFSSPGTWDTLLAALISTLAGAGLSVVGIVILTQYFDSVPGLSRLVLAAPDEVDPTAVVHIAGDPALGSHRLSVGDTGRVVSPLRPAGTARFGDVEADVTCSTGYADPHTPVRITHISPFSITVEEA